MGIQFDGVNNKISSGSKIDFPGSVGVAGTLTYEDVANVDSVGLITARTGIKIGPTAGVAATIFADGSINSTGIVTATTFVGALTGNVTGNVSGSSGSATGNAGGLTGTPNISCGTIAGSTGTFTGDVDIADKIVHTGDTNTAIRFPAADTITAETGGSERLRIDSSGNLLVGKTVTTLTTPGTRIASDSAIITVSSNSTNQATAAGAAIQLINSNSTNNNFSNIGGYNSNGLVISQINFVNTNHSSRTGDIGFRTHDGSVLGEKLRIKSDGDVVFTYNDSDTATQVGNTQVPHGLRINNENNTLGRLAGIHFAHGLGGHANAGIFHETTNTSSGSTAGIGDLTFWTKPTGSSHMTERLRIKSDGETVVNGDSNPCLSVDRGSANTTNINIKYNGSTRAQLSAASNGFEISAVGSTAPIQLYTNGTEKVQINASGNDGFLKIADNNTTSAGNHGFRFGAWGIQMRNTNGYDHWYIRRNNGGWQGPQITFKGNGHTGVNRTDPAETLDVDGGARFRSYVYIGDGFFIKSNAFGGNTNADTGISINQGGRGGCSLLLVSRNYNSGTGTSAGIYRIKWYYDGNNAPNTHHMSGDNWISFGVSGSNTLTVNGGGGNQIFGIIHITG